MPETFSEHAAIGNSPAAPPGNGPLKLSDRVKSLRLPENAPRSQTSWPWLPWTLCVILGISAGYFALRPTSTPVADNPNKESTNPNKESSRPSSNTITPNPVITQAQTSQPARDGDIVLEAKGYIIPISLIQVSPKVGGMVLELFIEEGKKVKKGEVLAELETTDYLADRDGAKHRWEELWKYREKEIRQAKADLEESQAQLNQLFAEWRRAVALKGSSISPKEFEQAESSYKAQKSRVEHLQLTLDLLEKGPRDSRIAAAKAELDKAQWKLDNCTVLAPVSGIILSKKAEKGNMVNPAAFSNGLSASLCEMADLTRLEVDLSIAERDIAKVFAGQKCQIRAEAYPDRLYDGVVSRVMPIADRAKGAVPVRVVITIPSEEEGQYLRPEMGAIVRFFAKK